MVSIIVLAWQGIAMYGLSGFADVHLSHKWDVISCLLQVILLTFHPILI